ncbi:MAG: methyltransferase domain-containing protein [Alphaproteobacteria bacterium]|jgi:cyclopropane-fatty-acyl-phospholipid synthase|nr:methyltransferase domain-containing protein [Alphaproteobacteria bacterium]
MSEEIQASRQSISQLKSVPASFRMGALALLRARRGRITVTLDDGRRLVFDHGEAGPQAEIIAHDYSFVKQVLAGGDIGFAEAYMDGKWSTPDLTAVLLFFTENFEAAGRLAVGGWMVRIANNLRHFFNRNSRAGARRNIMAHYDLGNDFYSAWLDPSMTYSSALYASPNQSLEQAQATKYEGIVERLGAGPDSEILEIGCGWGGFAEYAAKTRGARVTCLTISEAQADYARKRMQREGLSDLVDIRLEDYRDHEGQYDGVASIEMFEAVGEEYWPAYFGRIASMLKAGGRAALQIITIGDAYFENYRRRADFIQRYIFPGGMLPSESALKEQFRTAGLRHDAVGYFGQDYASTLKTWSKRFNEAWPRIAPLGFDDTFRRMWNFYLSYCEAGFISGRINVGQFQLSRA